MRTLNFLAALVFLSSFTPSPKEVKLEYTFKVGDQYVWSQILHQSVKQNIMGNEQVVENDLNGNMIFKIVSLTSAGAKIETKYTKLSMTMKMPAGMPDQAFNSDGDTSKVENKVMRALMNKIFFITMSKQGIIQKIDGIENLWSGLSTLNINDEIRAMMRSTLEQSVGEGSLRTSLETVLINYPDKKLKPGDSWTSKAGTTLSFPLETLNTWSLTNIGSETANITATGVISTIDKQKIVSLPMGIKSNFDLTGSQKIAGEVIIKSGWPSSVNVHSEITGSMKLLAGGMIPQDLDVPIAITTDSNFTIERK